MQTCEHWRMENLVAYGGKSCKAVTHQGNVACRAKSPGGKAEKQACMEEKVACQAMSPGVSDHDCMCPFLNTRGQTWAALSDALRRALPAQLCRRVSTGDQDMQLLMKGSVACQAMSPELSESDCM
eukprot:1161727-Pelagomonas_calceolata.AAC.17